MKKIILTITLSMFVLFYGMNMVEAKTYTTYNVGDEITVNLNDTLKEKFLVIENNSDSVKAIYKGALGEDIKWTEAMTITTCTFDGSVVDQALKQRTATWTNATNVTLPTANDIVGEFDYTSKTALEELGERTNPEGFGMVHLENLTNVPFYALNNEEGSRIFTNSVISYSDSSSTNCEIYVYGYAMTDFPFFYLSAYNEGSIRPIITVSKDYVVGGVTVTEEDKLWDSFVEKYKNTDIIKSLDSSTLDITTTSDSLQATVNNGTSVITAKFTYSNGIITYVPSANKNSINSNNVGSLLVEDIFVSNCLYALADLKGYDIEKVITWADSKKLTLTNDGIEFNTVEYTQEGSGDGGSISISGDTFTSFKLDIKNGLKTFNNIEEPKEDVVNNPDTGNFTQYGIVVAIIVAGSLGYISIRKHNKFPQA